MNETRAGSEVAAQLFEEAIAWLRSSYWSRPFFVERDIVWTIQLWLLDQIRVKSLPLTVRNDFPIGELIANARRRTADFALLDPSGKILLVAEFKYEPSHRRPDIPSSKLPVVFWGAEGVGKDVSRVREFVETSLAGVGYSLFIDEGSFFRHRQPHPGSKWIDWLPAGPFGPVSLLWQRVPEA
jgi:hypothetical protein